MATPSTLQGLVEVATSTCPGSAGFQVVHCTATRFEDGHVTLVLARLFGCVAEASKQQLDLPASRHVYLATDSDSNALVSVETADKTHIISLRAPTAIAVAQWLAALSTDASSDILSGLDVRRQTVADMNHCWSESTASSDEWDFGNPDKRPRHFSLDELLRRTALSSSSIDPAPWARQPRRVSSEPEVFRANDDDDDDDDDDGEDLTGLDDDVDDVNRAPSAAADAIKCPV